MLYWHIHPNVIFMYNMVACRASAESPILLGGELMRKMSVCMWVWVNVCVCVRCGLLPPIPLLTKSHGLYPALLFLYSCVTVLCSTVQLKKKKKATDSRQALTTFWTGLGLFYFQFKPFEISAWGNKVLIKRCEGEVQTETKITPTRSEVLSMTFFKSWSMYVVFLFSLGVMGMTEWGSGFFFKVLSAFHMWCWQHVFCINVSWKYYVLTCRCEWML